MMIETRHYAWMMVVISLLCSVLTEAETSQSKGKGLVVLASTGQVQEAVPSKLVRFGKRSDQILFQKTHFYVFNGTTSVGLTPDHFGVHRIVAPPYFAFPFSADLNMFGQEVKVNRFDWYPSECVCEGVRIKSVDTTMQVVPMKSRRGVLIELTVDNLNQQETIVPLVWTFSGSPGKSLNWEFSAETRSLLTKPRDAATSLKTAANSLSLVKLDTRLTASLFGADVKAEGRSIGGDLALQPGESKRLSLCVLIDSRDKLRSSDAKDCATQQDDLIEETRRYWTTLVDSFGARLPELTGGTSALQAFYETGVMSFLSTRFEVPEFLFNPYYATSGIDGGAANCYLWDTSYTAFTGAMLAPDNMRNLITQFLKLDINRCYAFDPMYGRPQGPRYSYNYYNLARLVYTYLAVTGDFGLMQEAIDGKPALTRLYEACLGLEDLNKPPTLLDYGSNHNLLELKRTQNYTHVTPSPNGERILTYRDLTDIYQALGRKTPDDLIQRGKALKKLYVRKLWNADKQWLNTLDDKGNPRISYSIQIFDVIRTGMLSKQQEQGILTHLNETEFLSEWGVHSLAKTDPGYDPRDVDWGGPGCYTGDPPELVVDLCQAGFGEQAVDVLNRILWWGEFPYLPQAMRANKKGYREDGRANLVSGGATCQAVINGLFGVRVDLNQVTIKPINHPMMEGLSLRGVKIRDRDFDIAVKAEKFTVTAGRKTMTKSLGESVILSLASTTCLKD